MLLESIIQSIKDQEDKIEVPKYLIQRRWKTPVKTNPFSTDTNEAPPIGWNPYLVNQEFIKGLKEVRGYNTSSSVNR